MLQGNNRTNFRKSKSREKVVIKRRKAIATMLEISSGWITSAT
jgi:hypothetical protein